MIRVAGDIYDSKANGPGMRYVLFTQGCTIRCEGCHNRHTWDKDKGIELSIDKVIENIKVSPFIDGVTISGGDPLDQAEQVANLCLRIKEECPGLNIMIYTGRTLEVIEKMDSIFIKSILKTADFLVDGRFDKTKTKGAKLYTGSRNQRIFNLKTREQIEF